MNSTTRRTALQSAAKFVIPTVTAFALTELRVAASGIASSPKKPKSNNGHHYGNDKPDTHNPHKKK